MTTPPVGPSAIRDIPAVHAAIAPSAVLRQQRRVLYQLASELLLGDGPQALDSNLMDSPLARHSIGNALAGGTKLSRSALVGISAVAPARGGVQHLRVTSLPGAPKALAPALETIEAELGRQRAACESPELLTETDGERFTAALAILDDGVALGRSVSPELIDDLLVHVALVGVLDPQRAGRLVSASPRAFPGLVLIKAPRSSIEVAEALIHEGAHQKLFDLAITHDLLNTNSDRCPPFHPPWGAQGRRWPLEQALAACHAYVCLARFNHDLSKQAPIYPLGSESLLPVASARSKILGEWLLDKGQYLGSDAHALLNGLIGQQPCAILATKNYTSPMVADYFIDTPIEIRRCGAPGRVLVGLPSQPPQFYWVSDDAATVLEFLAYKYLDKVATSSVEQCRMRQLDQRIQQLGAENQLSTLLSDLYLSGLVKPIQPTLT
jgi:hypothetical protein